MGRQRTIAQAIPHRQQGCRRSSKVARRCGSDPTSTPFTMTPPYSLLLLLFCLLLVCASTAFTVKTPNCNIQFRKATNTDVFFARKILFQEAMNPLSISTETLLVAYDKDDSQSQRVGFGQIRPLDAKYSELASLYVLPEYRQQGIGTRLVEQLLKQHDEQDDPSTSVCLLTLKPTVPFYQAHGFESVVSIDDLPPTIQFEYRAGQVVSSLLQNELVCIVRPRQEQRQEKGDER
jgi:amino-acid N-acetyltransferase